VTNDLSPPLSPSLLHDDPNSRRFLYFAGIYIALWFATWYSARLLDSFGVVSLWYLPAGFRFFSLLVLGWRGFLLETAIQMIWGVLQFTQLWGPPPPEVFSTDMLWLIYGWFAALCINAAAVYPLRRWIGNGIDLTRPAHSVAFLVAALAACAITALAGTFRLMQLGFVTDAQGVEVFAKWMTGDFIGIVTLVPLLLVRVVPGLRHYLKHGRWYAPGGQQSPKAAKRLSDLKTILIVALALLLVFGIPWPDDINRHFPLITLLLLLPLAGIALYHGLRAAVLAVVLLDGGLVVLISLHDMQANAFQFQIVMVAIAAIGVWLGGAVEARNRVVARYRDFASVSNDLLWEADRNGRVHETSGRLARYSSLSSGQNWRQILRNGPPAQLAALEAALSTLQPFRSLEFMLPDEGDGQRWIQVNGLPILDAAGELAGYRGTAVDVSLARQAETLLRNYNERLLKDVAERTRDLHQINSELATKERHLQVIFAAAPVGVLELDEEQRCHFINVNGCVLTGCTQEEAQGRAILDFVHPEDREYVAFVLKINQQSDNVQWIEFRLDRTNQRCSAHWINVDHADSTQSSTIMVLTSASARAQQDERLWTLAHHDGLTDLPNRNLFWDRMGQALRYAKRHESGAAVLWIDLDGFKGVNDRFGHAAGDLLLQQVAQRLRGRIRESDTVARMGGDEFAVIVPDISDADGALHTANALVASLAEPFQLPHGEARISASIGVALYPQHADGVESLTQCADMAMYQAKNSGKNQVRLWSAEREGEDSA
jgi:diguanylate cyclase (GGDEF)-like protein/PAS domain S-box-containing protein